MGDVSNSFAFSDFCDILEKIRKCSTSQERCDTISSFFKYVKEKCSSEDEFQREMQPFVFICLPDSNESIRFDMGEKKLCDLVSKVLDIPSLKADIPSCASLAAEVLAREVYLRVKTSNEKISVADIYNKLDDMSKKRGNEREVLFQQLLESCSEKSLVWVFNVIMRNVETYAGYSRRWFLSQLSPDANDSWACARDLRNLALIQEDEDREPDFYLGANFSPMLLARLTVSTIDEQMKNLSNGFFMEIKYDGEHVIMHKKGDQYKWFTRNGKDFTKNYGSNSTEKLSARIHSSFRPSVAECIIDCELMHYEDSTGKLIRHLDKGSDGVVLSYSNPQPGHRIVVVVFDLLYFGGTVNEKFYKDDLTTTPLVDRVEVMKDRLLRNDQPDNIFIAPRIEGTTSDDIRTFFKKAMDEKEEGIAIKRKDSLYFVGKRNKGNGWFKLKDRFDMDLVIVGIAPPKDERGVAFLLAAWLDTTSQSRFLRVISKSYSGLTVVDRNKILSDARRDGPLLSTPPDALYGWTGDSSYQYFRQNDWRVVEAVAFGVRNGHLVDTVMRRLRSDKDICREDIDDYRTIKQHNPSDIDVSATDEQHSTKRSSRLTKKQILSQGIDLTTEPEVKREKLDEPNVLTGKTVCVLQSFDNELRKKCMLILQRFGAKPVANQDSETILLVAPTEKHLKVTTAKKKNSLNIIKAGWLVRCDEMNRVESWLPSDVIHLVPNGFVV